MKVLDYERKFNQLSRYATHLISTDQMKAERFVEGLRPELSGIVSVLGDAVDRAQLVAMAPQRVNRNHNQEAAGDETPARNAPVQGNMGDLANIVANLVTIVQGLTQHNVANAQNGQNHHAPMDTTSQVVEQFRRYRPPVLTGREDPVDVEEWIGELEAVFDLIACSEAHRVSCAIFQLKQDAKHWWDLHRRTIPDEERNALTWRDFKEIVAHQFFPQAHRNKKTKEFMSLVQGNMKVLDYERKFNQLSRYATHLISTDQMKAERFVEGLRPELSGIVSVLGDVTYA
ncbi:hypothetical protein DH2020_000668 [Rehmannia glutinosa]|uniref:Retrotransposon gag domain-containing protein n=1 Tax=Rehmannia glutinosa TaxID=99300 RepID=A0ABR0XX93_REHGL